MVKVDHVHFSYKADKVITDLSMEVKKGQLVSILGENGSGKSTLLKLILGQLKPLSGTVTLLGKTADQMVSFKEIGYVPQVQNAKDIAFPITVLELVVLGLYESFSLIKIPRKKHKDKAKEILEELGLSPYLNAPFNELSGGLRQRAMIARAMINDPKILILDEPTAGVDEESKKAFLELLESMNKEKGITIIIVTHELQTIEEVLTLDQIYRMEEGRIINA